MTFDASVRGDRTIIYRMRIADGDDGFVGRREVVEPRRRDNHSWPNDMSACNVVECFRPGLQVMDVARRHDLAPHQLSDWRRQARQGL